VLEKLIDLSQASHNSSSWFTSFANAMTTHSQYGGAAFNASLLLYAIQSLLFKEARGIT
jgi:hypothetical protein